MVKGANLPVSAHLRIAMVLASKVRPRGIGGAAQCMPFGWPTIARPLHDSKRSGLNALALKVVPSQQQAYSGANVRAWRRHYVKNVGEDVCICVCYCIYIVEAFKKLFQVSEPSSPRTDLKL